MDDDSAPRSRESKRSPIEAALRYLGTRPHGVPVQLLEHAIDRPNSATGRALAPLAEPTAVLQDKTPRDRAIAVWRVIAEGIKDPSVSPTPLSRRRHVLRAAFRLGESETGERWATSLRARYRQLMHLTDVFGTPTTTQPMEMAWTKGVRALAAHLQHEFGRLVTSADWEPYESYTYSPLDFHRTSHGDSTYVQLTDERPDFREPSGGAQPFFMVRFVTTVLMKKHAVHRRITERLVAAQTDDVAYYAARASSTVRRSERVSVSARALWGCRAEPIQPSRPGEPNVTRLWFPEALHKGQLGHFASETSFQDGVAEERDWVNVSVDHHGIAQGQLTYDNLLPVQGLTIRIRFDESFLPAAVWWYAELTELERYERPPATDMHVLPLIGNDVQKTFTEQPCQPRESYGIAFTW